MSDGWSVVTTNRGEHEFREFMDDAEPRLRRSLVAAYGPERGREAAAEALAYGWEHWNRVRRMGSPVAYLYRVGQSRTRPRKVRTLIERHPVSEVWCEPGLPSALAALSERQRVRDLIGAAEPINFEEVAGRAPSLPSRRFPRVAAVACAAVVVAVAVGVAELRGGSTNGPTKIQVGAGPTRSDSQPLESTRIYKVPSDANRPTFVQGDRVIVDTAAFSRRDPTRFEVVWIKLPSNFAGPGDQSNTAPELFDGLLKRIVGLPGETIEGRDGAINIDGAILDESAALPVGVRSDTFGPVQIPAGSYFVLGDNRHYSNDSKNFGPIARSELVGPATKAP